MSLFAAAAAAPTTTKQPASKAKAPEMAVPGLDNYGALCALIATLTALKGTMEADVKAFGTNHFINEGMKLGRRPTNFNGVEGNTTSSIQLKSKASNQPISAEDKALLDAAGIPTKTADTVVTTFIINPAYAQDEELLGRVSKQLEKIKDLPADFIQLQKDQKTICDGDTTLDALFALKEATKVRELLPLVATLATKPTYKGKLTVALDLLKPLVEAEDEDKVEVTVAPKRTKK